MNDNDRIAELEAEVWRLRIAENDAVTAYDEALSRAGRAETDADRLLMERDEARADLATVRDTLRHRSNALNATGTHNDQLRAQLARIATELTALEPHAKDFATKSSLRMLSRFASNPLRAAPADKEPTP